MKQRKIIIFFSAYFTNLVSNSIIDLQIFSLTFECEYMYVPDNEVESWKPLNQLINYDEISHCKNGLRRMLYCIKLK